MDEGWIVAWLMLALAMMLIALAAAAEVSLGAISRANVRRLLDDGISRAQALQTLLDDPPRFILALMVLEILAFVLAASAAGWLAAAAGLQWNPGIGLNYQVRDGTGCTSSARATNKACFSLVRLRLLP